MPAMDALQGKIECGPVQFVSVGQLLPYVCYATPVLNRYLQDLSTQVDEAGTEYTGDLCEQILSANVMASACDNWKDAG